MKRAAQQLTTIRDAWLKRVMQVLAREPETAGGFEEQAGRFFDVLVAAVESGDAGLLDGVVATWSGSMTVSDLEAGESNVGQLLGHLMLQTQVACGEDLPAGDALEVIASVTPCFAHAYQQAARDELQARLEHLAKKLERAENTLARIEKSKADFISVAAHELKTPLTLIEGYAAMLRDALHRPPSGSTEDVLLGGIHAGAGRLRTIIDDMIDVSMIDNNLLALNFQPVWLDRLLSVLEKELAPALEERQQTLEVRPFTGCDVLTYGDPQRLLQVLHNVLSNAIKFTPDGGRILVDGRELSGVLDLMISDTGIGIDAEDQHLIFEKFGRLGNSANHSSGKTKFKGGGPGLGLHIARGIVEAHGGAIWVESRGYDEAALPGSTFHILLPLRSAPPEDRAASAFHFNRKASVTGRAESSR